MRALAAMLLTFALAACASDPPAGANLEEAARINTQLGIDYMRKGQVDLALEKLERALEQNEDYAPAHATIAFVHQAKGDNRLAEKHYRKSLSLDSANANAMNNFGVFLCGQGKAWEAEKLFLTAVQTRGYTTPEVAWTNAGLCAKSYDNAKAEGYFREALKINPELPEALAQMAIVSYRAKDFLRARAFMQRFERVGAPTAETLLVGAQTERELGDELAARKYEARLKRDFPESQEAANLQKKSSNDS